MNYGDALREWGARKIEERESAGVAVDRSTVRVNLDFDEGHACADASCSFARPPAAGIAVCGTDKNWRMYVASISAGDFDFAAVLGEIVAADGGTVTW